MLLARREVTLRTGTGLWPIELVAASGLTRWNVCRLTRHAIDVPNSVQLVLASPSTAAVLLSAHTVGCRI